ncbi:hypothetical protein EBN03_14605 [Nocardia stercoris]|uniref:Helicase C-terminal domain-containing protein n=1 Tax=Nocardia stercoris TaxID=2483361 RepID=A0A3M2L6P3_9NOCA|nr:hypothetical protein EBN03_14605 [Nocardia stercoris]
MLFSATLDGAVDELVARYLHDPVRHAVDGTGAATGAHRPNSDHDAGQPADPSAAEQHPSPATGGRSSIDSVAAEGLSTQPANPSPGTAPAVAGRRPARSASGIPADSAAGQQHPTQPPTATPAVTHHLFVVRPADKRHVVAHIAARPGRTLLFVRTQYAADKLGRRLLEAGVPAVVLHGGRTQNQRTRALAAFAGGKASALVATDVAARGIHVDDVSLVLHVDPPEDPKDYVHRAGRTARAGATGTVVTLTTPDERATTEELFTAASIPVTITAVASGDRILTKLTAARPPSGRAVPDPAAPPLPDTPQKSDTPNNFRRNRAVGNRPGHRGKR